MRAKGSSTEMVEPPEGVLSGDSIPRENELDDKEKMMVDELVSKMKQRGKPYTEMSDGRLEEMAQDKLVDKGVIR